MHLAFRRAPLAPVRLLLATGARAGTEFLLLGEGPWTIGRDPSARVALAEDPYVSRAHAEIRRERDGLVLLVTPHARNAAFVSGRAVPPSGRCKLVEGDSVTVGRSVLVLCRPAAAPLPGGG